MRKRKDIETLSFPESFSVEGGKLMVTDPCYNRGTWCQGTVENVQDGRWKGKLVLSDEDDWGTRVAELHAFHEDWEGINADRPCEFEVGVDSGQAGVFSEALYPSDETGDYGDRDSFYGRACEATLGKNYPEDRVYGGVITEGIVSSSGYGDGGYEAFTGIAREKVVAIKIVFIPEEEEEY